MTVPRDGTFYVLDAKSGTLISKKAIDGRPATASSATVEASGQSSAKYVRQCGRIAARRYLFPLARRELPQKISKYCRNVVRKRPIYVGKAQAKCLGQDLFELGEAGIFGYHSDYMRLQILDGLRQGGIENNR